MDEVLREGRALHRGLRMWSRMHAKRKLVYAIYESLVEMVVKGNAGGGGDVTNATPTRQIPTLPTDTLRRAKLGIFFKKKKRAKLGLNLHSSVFCHGFVSPSDIRTAPQHLHLS